MSQAQKLFEEMADADRKEMDRLTVKCSDLLAENKRLVKENKGLNNIIDAKCDNREVAEVVAENMRLKDKLNDVRHELKILKNCSLGDRLGHHKLHQTVQKSKKHYFRLIDELDKRGILLPPKRGNYSKRCIIPKMMPVFDSFITANYTDYYVGKVDRYNVHTNEHRFVR